MGAMGLGLAALGRPGYINLGHGDDLENDYDIERMRARTHAVLDAALAAGVRYFDTARSYGRAEEFLANWLGARGTESDFPEVFIASKWGYTYTADWKVEAEKHEVKEHSLENLDRQWRKSRDLLGNDLNLYQIHSATVETGVLENADVLNRLVELKQQGVQMGLSLSGPHQATALGRALEARVDGRPVFEAVQATYNILERGAGPALREAHDAGWKVIIKEGLANGRLTNRNNLTEDQSMVADLAEQAARLNVSPDTLALAFILAEPWVDIVLSGAATSEHLASNLRARELKMEQETRDALNRLEQSPLEYWIQRSGLAWQ